MHDEKESLRPLLWSSGVDMGNGLKCRWRMRLGNAEVADLRVEMGARNSPMHTMDPVLTLQLAAECEAVLSFGAQEIDVLADVEVSQLRWHRCS